MKNNILFNFFVFLLTTLVLSGCADNIETIDVKTQTDLLIAEVLKPTNEEKSIQTLKPLKKLVALAKKHDEYRDYFYKILSSERYKDKVFVILALIELQDKRLPGYLMNMLKSEHSEDRGLAITYLEEAKYIPAIGPLKNMSKNDLDERVRFLSKLAYTSIEAYHQKNSK